MPNMFTPGSPMPTYWESNNHRKIPVRYICDVCNSLNIEHNIVQNIVKCRICGNKSSIQSNGYTHFDIIIPEQYKKLFKKSKYFDNFNYKHVLKPKRIRKDPYYSWKGF